MPKRFRGSCANGAIGVKGHARDVGFRTVTALYKKEAVQKQTSMIGIVFA